MRQILIPEGRHPPVPRRSWLTVAVLCAPPLAAWLLIGLDLTGLWRGIGPALVGTPALLQAIIMLGSPAAATLIGGLVLGRRLRAGEPVDVRLLALAATGAALVLATATAAWATGS